MTTPVSICSGPVLAAAAGLLHQGHYSIFQEFLLQPNQIATRVAEVVVNNDFVAFVQQCICDRPADVAGASGNQDSQIDLLCSRWVKETSDEQTAADGNPQRCGRMALEPQEYIGVRRVAIASPVPIEPLREQTGSCAGYRAITASRRGLEASRYSLE